MVETARTGKEGTEKERMDMPESYAKASKYWQDIFNVWAKAVGSFPQTSGAAEAESWFKPFRGRMSPEMQEAERTAKESTDLFDFYNRASKYWLDIFNSWAQYAGNYPQAFKGMNVESWSKMPWSNMADWTRLYTGFTDMAKTMPLSFTPMKDASEAVAKGMNSYVKIYNAWLKGMDSIAREGYEIGQKAGTGEEVEVAMFFETLKAAYINITTGVLESLKDTPFAGIKGIDRVVREALDSLPEEQKMAREFFQELFNFSIKQRNLSIEAMKHVSKTSADMLKKGINLDGGYKNLIDAYSEMLKHSAEAVRVPAALAPEYKDVADDAASWAKANMDLSISWMEMNLKLYQGIARSAREMCKNSAELFEGGKISPASEFNERWGQACQQAVDTIIKDSQFSENIHKIMSSYTEWMKVTNKLCRSVMTSPCATREEFQRVSEELEKIKSSVEKRASARAKAEER